MRCDAMQGNDDDDDDRVDNRNRVDEKPSMCR